MKLHSPFSTWSALSASVLYRSPPANPKSFVRLAGWAVFRRPMQFNELFGSQQTSMIIPFNCFYSSLGNVFLLIRCFTKQCSRTRIELDRSGQIIPSDPKPAMFGIYVFLWLIPLSKFNHLSFVPVIDLSTVTTKLKKKNNIRMNFERVSIFCHQEFLSPILCTE